MIKLAEPQIVTQERNGARLVFALSEDKLRLIHSDSSGENTREIPWERIDLENSSIVRSNRFHLVNPDRVLMVMGFFMLYMSFVPIPLMLQLFGAASFGFGLRMYISRRRGATYSLFGATGQNQIRVMQDKQHDFVLAELKKGRGRRLKKLFGAVNIGSDPAKELMKFQWLKAVGAITEEELQQAEAEIRAQRHPVEMAASVVQ